MLLLVAIALRVTVQVGAMVFATGWTMPVSKWQIIVFLMILQGGALDLVARPCPYARRHPTPGDAIGVPKLRSHAKRLAGQNLACHHHPMAGSTQQPMTVRLQAPLLWQNWVVPRPSSHVLSSSRSHWHFSSLPGAGSSSVRIGCSWSLRRRIKPAVMRTMVTLWMVT